MTYRLRTFYCERCRAATPHETSIDPKTERERARCTVCADKQLRLRAEVRAEAAFSDTARHIAALDGAGNRGEK
jgi:transcription elongation factor Elf1